MSFETFQIVPIGGAEGTLVLGIFYLFELNYSVGGTRRIRSEDVRKKQMGCLRCCK
jgi:hypothetical protein